MSRLHEMTKNERKRHILREVLSLFFVISSLGIYLFTSNDWMLWATIGILIVYIAWILKRLFFPTDTEELPKRAVEGSDRSISIR